jgi:hypothetical protein
MKIKNSIKMRKYSINLVVLVALYCCVPFNDAQGLQPSYTVVAPKIVRPNSDFLVAVSLYNIDDEGGKFFNT